jgi:hypothetical protein
LRSESPETYADQVQRTEFLNFGCQDRNNHFIKLIVQSMELLLAPLVILVFVLLKLLLAIEGKFTVAETKVPNGPHRKE